VTDHQDSVDEIYELSGTDPERTWKIIQIINAHPIYNPAWQALVDGALATGPLENILALYSRDVLDMILTKAKTCIRLRHQLGMIYESSLPSSIWKKIAEVLKAGRL
jgi:hypothetical protein